MKRIFNYISSIGKKLKLFSEKTSEEDYNETLNQDNYIYNSNFPFMNDINIVENITEKDLTIEEENINSIFEDKKTKDFDEPIWQNNELLSSKISESTDNALNRVDEKIESIEKIHDKNASLLDNKIFIKLVKENVYIIEKFNKLLPRLEDNDAAKHIAEQLINDIKNALERTSVERIDEEVSFDPIRHEPIPKRLYPKGLPISEIIETGLAIENRVFLKALVKIEDKMDSENKKIQDKV